MKDLRLFKVYKIPIHTYCSSHVSGQKNADQPIFPYSPTLLARNSFSIGPNDLKFATESCMLL